MNALSLKSFPPLLLQLVLIVATAYLTAHFMVRETRLEQERQELAYVEQLKEAVRGEACLNARSIRRWIPKLVNIARDLQTFVNDKGASPPRVNPGHGGMTEVAFRVFAESALATRYIVPSSHTALATMHYRLREGNMIKRAVDTALADYTATFPGPLPEAHAAAARLHARIEQLLEVYTALPVGLQVLLKQLDMPDCPVPSEQFGERPA